MRKVIVSRRDYVSRETGWVVSDIGEAVFHGFGCDYEEHEAGPGNYSVAIVEYPDGRVDMVRPERIRFFDSGQGECDELAAQVEAMRDALQVAGETDQLQGGLWEERAVAVLNLPDTAAALLRQRDARTLRGAADICESRQTPGTGSVAILSGAANELRRMADELERRNAQPLAT